MTLFIQDYETEEVLFDTKDAITAPEKGESILLNNKWYEVVERNFSFKHLPFLDDNKCAIFVRPFKVKGEKA